MAKQTSQGLNDLPEWLTVPEVCSFLRLSKTSVYQMIEGGFIKHRRFGRLLRIPKASLLPACDADTTT